MIRIKFEPITWLAVNAIIDYAKCSISLERYLTFIRSGNAFAVECKRVPNISRVENILASSIFI